MTVAQVNDEIRMFMAKRIQLVPLLYFSQYYTLQDINFYYNSQFKTGELDEDGDRKYFFNVVKQPCKNFTKSVSFNTKDIQLLTVGGADPLKTWFMERDLKYWFKKVQFGKILNKLFTLLPIFGSVVLKIVDGVPYFVDLRLFVVDQVAPTLKDSKYIIEMHDYTVPEFRRIAKQMKWKQEDVDKVIDLYHQQTDTSHIRLYERYGEVADVDNSGNTTWTYKRTFLADVGIDQYDQWGNLVMAHPGVELSAEPWNVDDLPYWEFHVEKIPGRWLGLGVVETLREVQIRMNELANVQSKATYWAGLRVFQTQDTAVNRNLYTDTRNGEILNVDAPISQVDMSDRNLAFFNDENQKWIQHREELVIAFAPVGHSKMAIEIAQQQTIAYFEQIQESLAMDVKELLYEVIIPYFQKTNNLEHTLRIVGQDLDSYAAMCKNDLVNKEIIRQLSLGKPFPTNKDRDIIGVAIEQSIKQGKEKILTIPKNFYSDVKYDVDINIMGESVDTKARFATYQTIIQAITADPTILTDPLKKKLLAGMAEDGGISTEELFGADSPQLQDIMPNVKVPTNPPQGGGFRGAGGGVSSPMEGAAPGNAQKTI